MIKLAIEGMTCEHCVMAVRRALSRVSGVEAVEVNLEHGEALVRGVVSAEKLTAAVADEGYQARLVG